MNSDKKSGKTKKELMELARKHSIAGRSAMSKDELLRALSRAKRASKDSKPRDRRPNEPAVPKTQPPPKSRSYREPGGPRRRQMHPIDPAMKLSRVEEIRANSPSRPRRSGPKPGPSGDHSQGRHGRRPASSGRDSRSRHQGGGRRDHDRGHGRWGRRADRRPRPDDRKNESRHRRDERAAQAREHHRRTGDTRRQSSYRPNRQRPIDPHRVDAPRPAAIPDRLARRTSPPSPRRDERKRRAPGPYQPPELSEKYGVDRLVLLARDPYWLHAYWEVTPATLREAEKQLADGWDGRRWILRVRHFTSGEKRHEAEPFDVDLNPDARNWYLRVPHPDRVYEATIGVITRERVFYPFARSEQVHTPRAGESDEIDVQWSLDPGKAGEVYELSGGAPRNHSESGVENRTSPKEGGFSGMLGSMADRKAAGEKGEFWLEAETELIVYGSTKPDAKLSVQGRSVALRPDGSFTLRIQLPDGAQEIPCVSTSADGKSTFEIVETIHRQTRSSDQKTPTEPEVEI